MGFQGRLTWPPKKRAKTSVCWSMWDGLAEVLGVKVDVRKTQVSLRGLADLRPVSLYMPTRFSGHSLLILQSHLDLVTTTEPRQHRRSCRSGPRTCRLHLEAGTAVALPLGQTGDLKRHS